MLILLTACGKKKEVTPQPAWKLYKSARIRYLKRIAEEMNVPFYIVSAKYGLIHSEKIIEPYETLLTKEKAQKLFPQVIEILTKLKMEGIRLILYFKGGARKEYHDLVLRASSEVNLNFISYGSGYMKDIGMTKEFIEKLRSDYLKER